MSYCTMCGLHDSGLAACKALSCLDIKHSQFSAALKANVLRVSNHDPWVSIPARMSELTCLARLKPVVGPCPFSDFELDWVKVNSLVSLTHLQLSFGARCDIPEGLGRLTNLTHLALVCTSGSRHMSCSVEWKAMQTLEHIELDGPISFDPPLLQLTSIKALRCLKLTICHPCLSQSELARVVYRLAKCPQVQVHVDGELIG